MVGALKNATSLSLPRRDCVVILICHCERTTVRVAIFILSKAYEIASLITFARKDITTQSRRRASSIIWIFLRSRSTANRLKAVVNRRKIFFIAIDRDLCITPTFAQFWSLRGAKRRGNLVTYQCVMGLLRFARNDNTGVMQRS